MGHGHGSMVDSLSGQWSKVVVDGRAAPLDHDHRSTTMTEPNWRLKTTAIDPLAAVVPIRLF